MREKLIELLSEDFVEFCNVDIIAGHCKIRAITFDVDRFADHLIANGVVVLDVTQDVTQTEVDK